LSDIIRGREGEGRERGLRIGIGTVVTVAFFSPITIPTAAATVAA